MLCRRTASPNTYEDTHQDRQLHEQRSRTQEVFRAFRLSTRATPHPETPRVRCAGIGCWGSRDRPAGRKSKLEPSQKGTHSSVTPPRNPFFLKPSLSLYRRHNQLAGQDGNKCECREIKRVGKHAARGMREDLRPRTLLPLSLGFLPKVYCYYKPRLGEVVVSGIYPRT